MKTLLTNISELATPVAGKKKYLSGQDMNNLQVINNAAMLFDENILWVGTTKEASRLMASGQISAGEILDMEHHSIIPGFVDSHTHIVFGGNRSNEFGKRLRGATYQQIAEEGGGIVHTMNETRIASEEMLLEKAKKLALSAMSFGTTAMEVKSGYGLTTEDELKILRVIRDLKDEVPFPIIPTFMGAHDFPPEFEEQKNKYVYLICSDMIPKVAEENLAEFCDVFVDKGYFTVAHGKRIFEAALEYGMKLKIHADELSDTGAAALAAKYKAVSADHLLNVSDEGIKALKSSGTIATLLPGTAYFLKMPYAPARKMIDAGVAVALATDCNPGSCFSENMQTILSLAVMNMNMTAEEALTAATLNGAAALGKSDKFGSLEKGKAANFLVLNTDSYIDLFYHFGVNHISEIWINGDSVTQ